MHVNKHVKLAQAGNSAIENACIITIRGFVADETPLSKPVLSGPLHFIWCINNDRKISAMSSDDRKISAMSSDDRKISGMSSDDRKISGML